MKKSNILWGILLLLGAVFLIISNLGMVQEISILTIVLTVFFIGILINSIMHISFGGILFSLAFLCILYSETLGLQAITPWPVLGAALLGSIGLNMIFHKKRHCYNRKYWNQKYSSDQQKNYHDGDEQFDHVVNEPDGDTVRCDVHFSSTIKYVNSNQFESADIDCSFGAVKIFFDNALLKGNTATINLDVSFAGAELFVPHTWNVQIYAQNSFGGIEEKNKPAMVLEGAPVVNIVGNISFAGITIVYV